MSRKSKQQRINEGSALIATIKQDSILASEQGWLLHFLGDLVAKFTRGKGGTSRQRALFDEKIAEGVPTRKINTHIAQPIVAQMQEAIKIFTPFLDQNIYAWEHRVLGEMYVKGIKHNLSEKQVTMAEGILARAKSLEGVDKANTPEQIERIEYVLKCVPYYSENFFHTQVKKANAIKLAQAKFSQGMPLSEDEISSFESACSGAIKNMRKAERKVQNGALMKTGLYNPSTRSFNEKCALIISAPYIPRKGSDFHVDTIIEGEIKCVPINKVTKYTKKELKAIGAE